MKDKKSNKTKESKKNGGMVPKIIAGATLGVALGLVTYMFLKPGKSEKKNSQEYVTNEKTGERLFI